MSEIIDKAISSELKQSYLSYAMSVIVGRAIPDVRDGLKPVQRRILYSMMELGLWHNKPYKKSARIVGEVLGKYHPHGDTAVYDAMVRMAQNFSLRYVLVDGQGNFGSIDGDPPAAQRYTEARLSKIAEELLVDINKNTVDFMPNYDNTLKEPIVLPSRIPNLLINGASGIAVGMATNIPTHNLSEVIDALVYLIDNPDANVSELLNYIKGPDFPTGATIINSLDLKNLYETGKGSIHLRANYHIEEGKKTKIVFTDLPYKVNKSHLLSNIAKLVNDGRIKGITDIRDESNKEGIRIVIDLANNVDPEFIVNNLFKHTELETSFGAQFLVLYKNKPVLMNLKQILAAYLEHRVDVTKRWLQYDINKLQAKLHILEGLMIAINNLDETIEIIKTSKDPKTAKQRLMDRFGLDELQAQAILDMKLQKLTGLEIDNLKIDYNETKALLEKYKSILASDEKINSLIKEELLEIKQKYGDARKTELLNVRSVKNFNYREFIENRTDVVILTESGYIKRMPLELYKTQHRAGVGIKSVNLENDKIKDFVVANLHDVLYLFTNTGRLYTLDCYFIPEASRNSKGRYLSNLLKLNEGEKIETIITAPEEINGDIVIVTKKGKVKKMDSSLIKKVRSNGLRVITLNDNDEVISVKFVTENKKLLITSFSGKAVLFDPKTLRSMGRTAMGVKAMTLDGSEIVSVNVVSNDDVVLFVSKLGYGKKTRVSEFRETKRGAKGVKAMSESAGGIVKSVIATNKQEAVIVTDKGVTIRIPLENIPLLSRNTKGVRLIRLKDNDYVHDVEVLD